MLVMRKKKEIIKGDLRINENFHQKFEISLIRVSDGFSMDSLSLKLNKFSVCTRRRRRTYCGDFVVKLFRFLEYV